MALPSTAVAATVPVIMREVVFTARPSSGFPAGDLPRVGLRVGGPLATGRSKGAPRTAARCQRGRAAVASSRAVRGDGRDVRGKVSGASMARRAFGLLAGRMSVELHGDADVVAGHPAVRSE